MATDHAAEHGSHSHHHHNHQIDPNQHMVHRHRDVQGGTARAAVFGISDGLVSNTALILGVAAAATGSATIADANGVLIAGVSGLLAGAGSMAAGEYVSVKAQTELVERELEIERQSLETNPKSEIKELKAIYMSRGVAPDQAEEIATAVMADPEVALEVHAREELGVDPESVGNPVGAAVSSFIAFAIGAVLPLIPWLITSGTPAIVASIVIGLISAAGVGILLARFTERSMLRTATRQVGWATGACLLTWAIGMWLGTAIG